MATSPNEPGGSIFAEITLNNLNPDTERELVKRAAENGDSVEDEATKILDEVLGKNPEEIGPNLYAKIRAIVEPVGGIELELPQRSSVRPIPFLSWAYQEDELDNS